MDPELDEFAGYPNSQLSRSGQVEHTFRTVQAEQDRERDRQNWTCIMGQAEQVIQNGKAEHDI
jgi:hypothetical protein